MFPRTRTRSPEPVKITAWPVKLNTEKVAQSNPDSKLMRHARLPLPRPATDPVNVSVPFPEARPVSQLSVSSKFVTDVPVRLPLYCDVKPVTWQLKTVGVSPGRHVVSPRSVTAYVP